MTSLFTLGTVISLIAAILIEFYLLVALFNGVSVICSNLGVLGGLLLLLLAFAALYSYSRSSVHARSSMIYLAPLGILLGFIALLMVATGYSCPHAPIRVLALAYIVESIVGYRLRLDFEPYSRSLSQLFFAGILVFTIGLIAVSFSEQLLVVALLGNSVKLVALTILTYRVVGLSPQAS